MKFNIKEYLPKERKVLITWIALVVLAFLFGLCMQGEKTTEVPDHAAEQAGAPTTWTCSMHPQIQQPGPGQCPICGMDLIPVTSGGSDEGGTVQLVLSENGRKLASIEVAPVERKFVEHEIRLAGKIDYDETRVKNIAARTSGRIDKLFVNFTGVNVRKNDHLFELYSPEILTTHRELLESHKSLSTAASEQMRGTLEQQLNSVRERLRLWGLTTQQISDLENQSQPTDHVTIYSPLTGVVVQKDANEGAYVNTGTKIFTIADLSKVWLIMEAYETDLPWLRYGQTVEFRTEAFPGELFRGRIAFIEPMVNAKTRTIKIRVNVDNREQKLKPEMLARAVVHSQVAAGGKVMEPDLAGKWISPMHPEVIKDGPGKCDVCGMPLVKAEALGFVSTKNASDDKPLVIPASAPLITGKRAVVYIEVPGKTGTYEGREIQLGPRAGDFYLVESGLEEGEKVVVQGNFKIDSAIQIQAKPSMMNPVGGKSHLAHPNADEKTVTASPKPEGVAQVISAPAAFIAQLEPVYTTYFEIQYALSHDKFEDARKQASLLLDALKKVDMKLLSGEMHQKWMKMLNGLKDAAQKIDQAEDMEHTRIAFEPLSMNMISTAKAFGSEIHNLRVYHCPMAFDFKGADWLQNKAGTENPYFGSAMFSCGEETENLSAQK